MPCSRSTCVWLLKLPELQLNARCLLPTLMKRKAESRIGLFPLAFESPRTAGQGTAVKHAGSHRRKPQSLAADSEAIDISKWKRDLKGGHVPHSDGHYTSEQSTIRRGAPRKRENLMILETVRQRTSMARMTQVKVKTLSDPQEGVSLQSRAGQDINRGPSAANTEDIS